MNDRYLFKAKHLHLLKNNGHLDGIWVKGYLVDEKYIVSVDDGYEYLIDPNTICQCTGLKDKNGKLIWEHDIVEVADEKSIIEWQDDSAMWGFLQEGSIAASFDNYWSDEVEVIGNEFDNPELLESEE